MSAPTIARILGLVFAVAGVAGLLPWTAPAAPFDAPVESIDIAYRTIAGIFPVNVAHDVIHLFFGLWGLLAALRWSSSIWYLRTVTWVYLLLALLGVIPYFPFYTLFGIAPIYGWDALLHFAIAILAAYGGYGRGSIEPEAVPA
jgi:hypothetical protein